jgi:hypothetical protein
MRYRGKSGALRVAVGLYRIAGGSTNEPTCGFVPIWAVAILRHGTDNLDVDW